MFGSWFFDRLMSVLWMYLVLRGVGRKRGSAQRYASLVCSPVYAKAFVGVLWPMFGPLPAPGLVELVAELRMMPDVEVRTYLHQSWPALVEDIDHQPPGTHTVVVGYSLGANSSVFVANKAKYVDLIVALQPSMFSWNPPVTGNVGRMIEIYNPNPAMTFGGWAQINCRDQTSSTSQTTTHIRGRNSIQSSTVWSKPKLPNFPPRTLQRLKCNVTHVRLCIRTRLNSYQRTGRNSALAVLQTND
jgi:hypothetical protein